MAHNTVNAQWRNSKASNVVVTCREARQKIWLQAGPSLAYSIAGGPPLGRRCPVSRSRPPLL